MKRIAYAVAATLALCACEVVIEPQSSSGRSNYNYHDDNYHDDSSYSPYSDCYDYEEYPPYYHSPSEIYYYYDDYTGEYEGECSTWLVDTYYSHEYTPWSNGTVEDVYEEWCLWIDQCGWEYITTYSEYSY